MLSRVVFSHSSVLRPRLADHTCVCVCVWEYSAWSTPSLYIHLQFVHSRNCSMSSVLFAAQSVTEAPRHARLPVFLINKHLGGISGALRGVIRKKNGRKNTVYLKCPQMRTRRKCSGRKMCCQSERTDIFSKRSSREKTRQADTLCTCSNMI